MSEPKYPRLIMLGTAAHGGIVAVVEAWRAHGLFQRWPIEYLPTHCNGNALRKLLTACSALAGVALTVLRHGPVILHLHTACDVSFWRKAVFMAFGRLARCPVILHLHGGRFVRFYEAECGPLGRRVIRYFLNRATRIIVLSESWRDWVKTVSGNPGIVCLPNPVLEPAARGVQTEPNTLLFMGLLRRDKGVFDLMDALAMLRVSVPNARLVCAGDGDVQAVVEHARRLGIADAVTFPGWVSGAEKARWLQRAAVFVLPSYAEGMPMSLLEAMAAGVPTVSTSVGSIPEVVSDGGNGFLVAPGDIAALEARLRTLLREPQLAARLAAAARETVRQRFAADGVLARLEQVYAEAGLASQMLGAPDDPVRPPLRKAA